MSINNNDVSLCSKLSEKLSIPKGLSSWERKIGNFSLSFSKDYKNSIDIGTDYSTVTLFTKNFFIGGKFNDLLFNKFYNILLENNNEALNDFAKKIQNKEWKKEVTGGNYKIIQENQFSKLGKEKTPITINKQSDFTIKTNKENWKTTSKVSQVNQFEIIEKKDKSSEGVRVDPLEIIEKKDKPSEISRVNQFAIIEKKDKCCCDIFGIKKSGNKNKSNNDDKKIAHIIKDSVNPFVDIEQQNNNIINNQDRDETFNNIMININSVVEEKNKKCKCNIF